jgi:uncharacterized protein (DUF305 family)
MRIGTALLIAVTIVHPFTAFAQDEASEALMTAMGKMMTAMHTDPSGDPDRDFATMMIAHHQGAIDMAKVELDYGDDPELRALAEAIIKAQTDEITQMKEWLTSQD